MSAQMNVTDIKVEENNSQIDHILRLRNGRMYEIGCWIGEDSDKFSVVDELTKDPSRVVSMSVYPKDKTLARGTTEPILFNMFMENFLDEQFGILVGSMIALRIWSVWSDTNEWSNRHFIEGTYLGLAEAIFGKELEVLMARQEAKKAVEIMKQHALEHRQAKEKQLELERQAEEAKATRLADELKQRLDDEDEARRLEAMKPKEVKVKKDKPKKAPKNPFPEEIRISEGIWKKNPKWIKWEKENK